MKRKTVLRILSCALACTMLFETPLQAAAVTDGVSLQTDDGETGGQDAAADGSGTDGQDIPVDDSETGGQDIPVDDSGADGPDAGIDENASSKAPEKEDGETQQDIPVDTFAPNISNSLPTAGADNGMLLQELQPAIQTGELKLSFDVQAENTFDSSGYEELTAVLTQTWIDRSTESVDVASEALSLDVVKDLLEYMIWDPEYDTSCLRPQVSYAYIIEDTGDV